MNTLADKLQGLFKKLKGYGKLNEDNISEAVREVRLALLAADVNYQIAKDFCARVKEQALGKEVQASVRPGDYFVKIVHDELVATFTSESRDLAEKRPLKLALVGLNGAGKTTTAGKLAHMLKQAGETVQLVAADLTRPAAADQLSKLGEQISIPVQTPESGQTLAAYLDQAADPARYPDASVVIYDLAGRTDLNEELLDELNASLLVIEPDECLLVADAATGQAATELAQKFQANAPLTGLVLSRFDGDTRGGAALSLQAMTGAPVKFLGTGEKIDALEVFHPDRLVKRLLGMGDLYGLAEKVQGEIDLEDAARFEEKLRRQSFDLQDFLDQMRQIKKLGPLQNLLGMMPGMGSVPDSALDEQSMKRTEAIVLSMTPQERRRPEILNASRRKRIAAGSGVEVMEVNELLRRFRQMKKMMTKVFKGGNPESKMKKLLSGMAPGNT
ncbi:MAG: signal recognition particle protein [Verrucomicrobiota bacterium]